MCRVHLLHSLRPLSRGTAGTRYGTHPGRCGVAAAILARSQPVSGMSCFFAAIQSLSFMMAFSRW